MALRAANMIKLDDENAGGRVKKEAIKRGALGEISNRIVSRSNSVTFGKMPNLKDVKAKVVTRHAVATTAKENDKPKARAMPTVMIAKKVEVAKVAPVRRRIAIVAPAEPALEPAFSAELVQVEDADKEEDPLLASMYVADIYNYLRKLETQFKIQPSYLEGQAITSRMRSVLVDWLTEVQQQFHLLPDTLYLNVAIVDRFLQEYRTIDRQRLQLVGVAAMSLASKYEETYAPEIGDYVYISDNTYTKAQILEMECVILKTLNFSFGRPLPLSFLRRYSKIGYADPTIHTLAKYILELQLTDYKMCHLAPSLVAAASSYLAMWLLGDRKPTVWTNALMYYSSYSLEAITPVVRKLAGLLVNVETSAYKSTRTKYASSKFLQISKREELRCDELRELANGTGDF